MRRAPKVDANHREVVAYLRHLGWSVLSLAAVGKGCPDLVVSRDLNFTALVEVKDGAKPKSAQRLTEDQRNFMAGWKGRIIVANSPTDAAEQLLSAWHFMGRGRD